MRRYGPWPAPSMGMGDRKFTTSGPRNSRMITFDWDDVEETEPESSALDRLGEISARVLVLVGGLDLDTVRDAAVRVISVIAGAGAPRGLPRPAARVDSGTRPRELAVACRPGIAQAPLSGRGAEDAAELRRWAWLLGRLGGCLVLAHDLRCAFRALGQLGLELANLARSPGRCAEPVVGDRGHHQEPRVGRVNASIQPISSLHAIPLALAVARNAAMQKDSSGGMGHSIRPEH